MMVLCVIPGFSIISVAKHHHFSKTMKSTLPFFGLTTAIPQFGFLPGYGGFGLPGYGMSMGGVMPQSYFSSSSSNFIAGPGGVASSGGSTSSYSNPFGTTGAVNQWSPLGMYGYRW